MKTTLLFLSLAVCLAACNDSVDGVDTGSKNDSSAITSPGGKEQREEKSNGVVDVSGCYLRVIKRDTLAAHLQQDGNKISGRLSFDNYQKDGSTGTVTGEVTGDVVRLNYRFQSEGTESTMEVYFKKEGQDLIQGTGDMDGQGRFTEPNAVNYANTQRLQKIDCSKLAAKYQ